MDVTNQAQKIAEARRLVQGARTVAVLTGAGISAESGVPTYRGAGGLWSGFSAEDLASPEGFARRPDKVWQWHDERRLALKDIQPNPAHFALAQLQKQLAGRGGWLTLATQNIDGLHQAAGSEGVLELHGTILTIKCTVCPGKRPIGFEPIEGTPRCPTCGRPMRPDIVWFGEALPTEVWDAADRAAQACEVFLTIGTSALVYPAAGLIQIATGSGAKTIEVNLEPTPASSMVDIALHGQAGEILPQIVQP